MLFSQCPATVLDLHRFCSGHLRFLMAQPTTRREKNSMITARETHPAGVQTQVMSPAQFWFGPLAVQSCCKRFGAMVKV